MSFKLHTNYGHTVIINLPPTIHNKNSVEQDVETIDLLIAEGFHSGSIEIITESDELSSYWWKL